MLNHIVALEIKRLLDEKKLSQRKIARKLLVSRGIVNQIATGRRPMYPPKALEDGGDEPIRPTGPLVRCRKCGGRVYMPCRLCRLRKKLGSAKIQKPSDVDHDFEPLGLELRPEHETRYQEVREFREYCKKHELNVSFEPGILEKLRMSTDH